MGHREGGGGRGGSYTLFTIQPSNSGDNIVKSLVRSYSQIFVQDEMKYKTDIHQSKVKVCNCLNVHSTFTRSIRIDTSWCHLVVDWTFNPYLPSGLFHID